MKTRPETRITGYQWLEKLLNQRLNEILDSMHKPELKGKLLVKVAEATP